MTVTPPPDDRISRGVRLLQGLTLGNVLILFLLVLIGVPVYVIWKAVSDDRLLDRLLSTYEEFSTDTGCLLRHVQERGGPDMWGVSSGFAFQGQDRWFVSVVTSHEPRQEEVLSYCASLKLLADRLADRRDDDGNVSGP